MVDCGCLTGGASLLKTIKKGARDLKKLFTRKRKATRHNKRHHKRKATRHHKRKATRHHKRK